MDEHGVLFYGCFKMNVENIKLVLDNGTIFSYESSGDKFSASAKELAKYWPDCLEANEDGDGSDAELAVEGGKIKLVDGAIVGILNAYSGQSGVVFIWDCLIEEYVHISDGCFAIDAIPFNGFVYSLSFVSYYGIQSHVVLNRVPIGTKYISNTLLEQVEFQSDENLVEKWNGSYEAICLAVEKGKLLIKIGNNHYDVKT